MLVIKKIINLIIIQIQIKLSTDYSKNIAISERFDLFQQY